MGRAADLLRLVRAPLAPTAALDALACATLARGPGLSRGAAPLSLADAALLCTTSLLVYAAGMAGNDLADREIDRTIHPERPLPSGRLPVAWAVALVVLAAAGALLIGGGPSGSRVAVAVALGLAFAYDGALKRSVAGGALAMGLVRASNAACGVLPLWASGETSAVSLAAPLCIGLYSAGVTVLSTAEGRPALERPRRLVARVAAAVAVGAAGVLAGLGAAGLAVGSFLALGILSSIAFARVPRPGAVKAQVFEMLLGLFWLEAILATGARPGSDALWGLGAVALAFGLSLLAQIWARALRRSTP